jgi:hypothetical protein
MLAGLSTLPILSLSALLLLRCRRSKSAFLSPAVTAGELTATGLRMCTGRAWWWWCDGTWPKWDIFCAGVRLYNCAVLDSGERSSFSSGSSYSGNKALLHNRSSTKFIKQKNKDNSSSTSYQFWMFDVRYFPTESVVYLWQVRKHCQFVRHITLLHFLSCHNLQVQADSSITANYPSLYEAKSENKVPCFIATN